MTDCSLDDYIKTNHITRNDRGRGGGGKWTKGFQRKDNGGFRSSGQFSRGITKSSNYPRRPSFLPNSGSNRDRWQHDLFASGAAGYGGLSQDAPYEDGNRSNGGTKLLISNLDFGVSDGDIKELFGEFGPLRKSALHYDQSGRSIGTAEVTFISSADALVAYHKYNGVPLDGRAMNIQIVGGGGNGMFGGFISPPSYGGFGGRGWSGSSGFSGGRSRGFRSGGSFRGNMRGGLQRRDGRPDMTLEQLDMELEEYQSHTA